MVKELAEDGAIRVSKAAFFTYLMQRYRAKLRRLPCPTEAPR